MTNFTFNNSPIKDISEFINSDGSFTAVEKLLREYSNRLDSNNTNLEPSVTNRQKATVEYNYDILLDQGSGRISRGLNSLLTLSRIISGKSSTSPMILSNPILYSNPTAVKNADKLGLRVIVLGNLGLGELINHANEENSTFVTNTLNMIDNIGRDVQQGKLTKGAYDKDMIARSKQLVRLSDKHNKENNNG